VVPVNRISLFCMYISVNTISGESFRMLNRKSTRKVSLQSLQHCPLPIKNSRQLLPNSSDLLGIIFRSLRCQTQNQFNSQLYRDSQLSRPNGHDALRPRTAFDSQPHDAKANATAHARADFPPTKKKSLNTFSKNKAKHFISRYVRPISPGLVQTCSSMLST
jgi:hypothetical protein